ncbi:hypothetical protein GGTG_06985 [Gaeumannomyces tritici R3-111a-1]|uniref:Uncharacterized protein n=1 Tax=Gaeumannomyces tritici (strain R3-111a-1) TaxID=644352 RepID=J3P0D8_GAET3|nr:hypothetical protein GGTG_06985 [Gaeumannomyces tritici R3-111a-1]EJT77071.1 hypothetical protein GGTG_06985 [Gaeumannomyces tritici R3-111a-1]
MGEGKRGGGDIGEATGKSSLDAGAQEEDEGEEGLPMVRRSQVRNSADLDSGRGLTHRLARFRSALGGFEANHGCNPMGNSQFHHAEVSLGASRKEWLAEKGARTACVPFSARRAALATAVCSLA